MAAHPMPRLGPSPSGANAPPPPSEYQAGALVEALDGDAASQHMLRHMPGDHMLERHVKLFRNGANQAVRIPREFELPGQDAVMRKEGDRLIIEPAPAKSLLRLLATLPPIEEEFAPIPDLPPEPVDL